MNDREQLQLEIMQAHYNALREYRKDVKRRIAHIIVMRNKPHTLALNMSEAISEELERVLAGVTHEQLIEKVNKML